LGDATSSSGPEATIAKGWKSLPLQVDQVPVRLSQDSASGIEQKHGATDNTVCAQQLVDGEKAKYSKACRMSAPAAWENAQKKATKGHPTGVKAAKWMNQKNIISSGELLLINSSFCRGYSELPLKILEQ
jgi:hypothetical protein